MSNANAVELSGIMKRFGGTTVVNDISLAFKQGEFFSLLGPSGCGKSTLLRMIAGFEEPTQGVITVSGNSVEGVPANQRPINMVFQDYAIFPHLDVANNIAFGLRRMRLSKRDLGQRVDGALEKVGLASFAKRQPSELSGGQRQRVALARALILEPEVLLLDEPLSALDKQLREKMQIELRRLQRSEGITFVLVTHDQSEALAISDRCGVMFDGQLEQVTSPSGLYDYPKNRQVAEFIGKMNYLNASVDKIGDDFVDLQLDRLGPLRVAANGVTPQRGQSVVVGVRPERVYLDYEPSDEVDITIPAVVQDITFCGESIHYFLELENREERMLAAVANFSYSKRFHKGDRVHVSLDGRSMVLLS